MKQNQLIPAKRLYTLKEAAIFLGRTLYSVRELVWARELPIVKHGKKQWVDVQDLNNFIEKHKGFA